MLEAADLKKLQGGAEIKLSKLKIKRNQCWEVILHSFHSSRGQMGGWLWAGSSPAGVTGATGAKIISILAHPWVEKKNTGHFM